MSETSVNESPAVMAPPFLKSLSKNWWVLVIRGVLLIALGAYALLMPEVTLAAYCFVLGIFLLIDGIVSVIAGVVAKVDSKLWTIVRGVIEILIGLVIVAQPAMFATVAALTIVFIIAFTLIFNGGLEIFVAIRDRKKIQGEGWLILIGVLTILFGVVLLGSPLFAASLFIMIAGAFNIVYGVLMIVTAFQLRRVHTKLTNG